MDAPERIWLDIDYAGNKWRLSGDQGGAGYVRADLYAKLEAENERLKEALMSVIQACDSGRMVERGVGGMTIDAQIRRSVINGVPAWPIEEARSALSGGKDE